MHELQVQHIELELQNEELKRAKSETEASLEQYTALYDYAPTGYFSLDANGQIREVNLTGAALLGIERARLTGRRFQLFIAHASREDFQAFFERVFSEHDKQTCEVALLKIGGPVFWAELQASAVSVPDGERRWCRVTLSDISDRKRAEEALREKQWRLRYAAESARLTYVELDFANGKALTAENFEEVMGYAPPLPLQTDFATSKRLLLQFVIPEDRRQVQAAIDAFMCGQLTGKVDYRLLGEDGTERWLESRWSLELDSEGKPLTAFATSLDITERKQAEAARRESEARYRTLFDSIDEAFCVIELIFDRQNKPVDFRFLEVNPTFVKHTGLADVTGRLMRELVPGLEDNWFEIFGKVALDGEAVRFVHETSEMGGRWFDTYACRLGPAQGRKVAVVLNDISERRQSEKLLNESHLALQAHAEELGLFNRVAVGRDMRMIDLKKEVNELCLARNEPPRYPLVFEEPSTSSVEDVLATFEPEEQAEEAAPASPSELPRLLIAEDDPSMREYLLILLEPHYRVEALEDGQAALESALVQAPDILLTDVWMPRLDGLNLLRRLRADKRTRNIPVVMLSGRASDEAREEGIVTGADDYLIKPFNARELLERLRSQLELAHLRRESERHHLERNAELARRVDELQLANARTREARRAALNVMEDALESRRTAEALTLKVRISEVRYRRLFEAALDGVLLLDPVTRKITDANPFMTKLLGYPHEELVGKELFEIGLLKDEATSQAMVRKLKRKGQVRFDDLPLASRDGGSHDVEVVANLYEEDGRTVIQCNIRDITQRKRAEENQRGLEVMTASNAKLKEEIVRRRAVEAALTKSERRARLLLEQATALQAKLRELSRRMLSVQEEQRKKISRELHDDISQLLVGIIVHLANVNKAAKRDPESIQKTITPLLLMVEESVRVVHRFARELRPAMLDDLGLVPAIEAYINDYPEGKGLRVEFTAFSGDEALDIEKRTMLYRVAQEALTNVAKHAQASLVHVSLSKNRGRVRLEVRDNGRAFDVRLIASPQWHDHLGLVGMRERVEMVGGRFEIVSTPGTGTIILAEVPTS